MHPTLLLCPCDRTDPAPWHFALWKSEAACFLFFQKYAAFSGVTCLVLRREFAKMHKCTGGGKNSDKPALLLINRTLHAQQAPWERGHQLIAHSAAVWAAAALVPLWFHCLTQLDLDPDMRESKALHFCTRAVILHFSASSTQRRRVIEKEALFDVMLTFASCGSGGQEVNPLLCARCIRYSTRWDFPWIHLFRRRKAKATLKGLV